MRKKERESGKKSMRKALRVFIDTNVLLSGLLFSGNEHRILKSAQPGKLKLMISQDVIEEAEAVIRRKFFEAIDLFYRFLEELNFEYLPREEYQKLTQRYRNIIRHDADLPILTSAVIARSDFLVTSDKHFHTTKVKKLLRIVRPIELLKMIEK